jgi:ribonuclease HIII
VTDGTSTFVTRMGAAEGRRLYDALGRERFGFRPVPYSVWSARGDGTTVTLYTSGKLVVQGPGTSEFVRRFLGREVAASDAPARPESESLDVPTIGSDESGKGDYFGPLAVAAALARPKDAAWLESLGVVDSKLAGEQRIRQAEGLLAQSLPHAVRVLSPEEYNARWAKVRNVNVLLGALHAEVLEEVASKAPGERGLRIVVDQFGSPEHVVKCLGPSSRRASFTMRTGGESNPAVAAASFLARAAFLRGFDEVRNLAGPDVPRGASDPHILVVARRLLREGGEPWLSKFAKLHFKVTAQARGERA